MASVLAPARLSALLQDRPWWHPRAHSLQQTMTIADRAVAMALLEELRACGPGHGSSSVQSELCGTRLTIRSRSLGYVGVTDDDLRLARDVDAATDRVAGPGHGG